MRQKKCSRLSNARNFILWCCAIFAMDVYGQSGAVVDGGAQLRATDKPRNEAEGNSQTPAPATTVQRFEEIRVLSTLESADGQKSPISRMRESLDKVGKSRENFVEESKANDGSRYAQIKVAGSIFRVEERRSLINFSGIDEKPIVTQPIGKKCRCGQY